MRFKTISWFIHNTQTPDSGTFLAQKNRNIDDGTEHHFKLYLILR